MQPQPEDTSFSIPVTFDYKGGRASNRKWKIISTLIVIFLSLGMTILFILNDNLEVWQRVIFAFVSFYVGLLILRFVIYNEIYFSDVYEELKKNDFILDTTYIWQIFDIDYQYPYVCYFKNGQKGIFVRMERDTITGKPDTAMYDHYECVGDSYNVAHALNMDITIVDYMDNVGNDKRLKAMYDDLAECENPDMQEMMIDIYNNLEDEMSRNYSSYDIYLFRTRDKSDNFIYNVQSVCNTMIGGNFITYKVLNKDEISTICKALFNLHDFSVNVACENALATNYARGIVPISITHADGSVEELNKTQAEKKLIQQENARKQRDRELELERKKEKEKQERRNKRRGIKTEVKVDNTEVDIFGDVIKEDSSNLFSEEAPKQVAETKSEKKDGDNDENLNLF